jgi:hypothetical protein
MHTDHKHILLGKSNQNDQKDSKQQHQDNIQQKHMHNENQKEIFSKTKHIASDSARQFKESYITYNMPDINMPLYRHQQHQDQHYHSA